MRESDGLWLLFLVPFAVHTPGHCYVSDFQAAITKSYILNEEIRDQLGEKQKKIEYAAK